MWDVIWHVVVGVGLIAAGGQWILFFFVMSVMTTDAGDINWMTFLTWAIAALGLLPAAPGILLLLTVTHPSWEPMMWHFAWHILAALGLVILGAVWFPFVLDMEGRDKSFGIRATATLGLIPIGFGIWLVVTI